MKSGLEGRNNAGNGTTDDSEAIVSMKSGLEGRNNTYGDAYSFLEILTVSMKSGLEGRNNRGHLRFLLRGE